MIEFRHRQTAHCETGAAVSLLGYYGLELSEAMAFGLGRGLFFGYLPFIRINGMPLVTYRAAAGAILKNIAALPGITVDSKRFRSPDAAMADLDRLLDRSIPVGLQTGVYWLPYFPRALRFHFNAHNIVVYGREGGEYLVSDPVFPAPVRCLREDLARARFAAGALAPRGRRYFLLSVPEKIPCDRLIPASLGTVCNRMLNSRFPLVGTRGIRFLASRMEQWPGRLGPDRADLHVGHVIRMQEEIGTGGGGFRFMFAAFLQESGQLLDNARLRRCGDRMVEAGDLWREFAVMGARICKGRERSGDSYSAMAAVVRDCARVEERIYRDLVDLYAAKRPTPARK